MTIERVVGVGGALVRLTSTSRARLEQAQELRVTVGGAELSLGDVAEHRISEGRPLALRSSEPASASPKRPMLPTLTAVLARLDCLRDWIGVPVLNRAIPHPDAKHRRFPFA